MEEEGFKESKLIFSWAQMKIGEVWVEHKKVEEQVSIEHLSEGRNVKKIVGYGIR